jgi:hypothetical protein
MIRARRSQRWPGCSAQGCLRAKPSVAKKYQRSTREPRRLAQRFLWIPFEAPGQNVPARAAWTAAGCEPVPTLLDQARRRAP